MLDFYTLDENRRPVQVESLDDYFDWLRAEQAKVGRPPNATLHVARDVVELRGLDARAITISTVYLGMDHRFGEEGPPVLWETMVFGLHEDDAQERYTSEADALAGHQRWLSEVMARPGARRRED